MVADAHLFIHKDTCYQHLGALGGGNFGTGLASITGKRHHSGKRRRVVRQVEPGKYTLLVFFFLCDVNAMFLFTLQSVQPKIK